MLVTQAKVPHLGMPIQQFPGRAAESTRSLAVYDADKGQVSRIRLVQVFVQTLHHLPYTPSRSTPVEAPERDAVPLSAQPPPLSWVSDHLKGENFKSFRSTFTRNCPTWTSAWAPISPSSLPSLPRFTDHTVSPTRSSSRSTDLSDKCIATGSRTHAARAPTRRWASWPPQNTAAYYS